MKNTYSIDCNYYVLSRNIKMMEVKIFDSKAKERVQESIYSFMSQYLLGIFPCQDK